MPPPGQPNFLPQRGRSLPLDPTRHLKSRELWNQVRFHASASQFENQHPSSSSTTSSSTWNWKYYQALLRAILYEIQPFRVKPCLHRMRIYLVEEEGFKKLWSQCADSSMWFCSAVAEGGILIYQSARSLDKQSIQQSLKTIYQYYNSHQTLLTRSIFIIVGLKVYHRTLLYLHELFHAGPILVIVTLLVLLYTVGLGDNTGAQSGLPSAYSVFNRGMRRIMGTVDGEELARQYAGGAAAMVNGGGGGAARGRGNEDDELFWVPQEGDNDEDWGEEENEQEIINERRRRRRLERLQRRANENDDVAGVNDDGAEGAEEADQNEDIFDEAELEEETIQQNGDQTDQSNHQTLGTALETSRKSGKKARRRNLELRREMQRQRQAAAALGYGAGDDIPMNNLDNAGLENEDQ